MSRSVGFGPILSRIFLWGGAFIIVVAAGLFVPYLLRPDPGVALPDRIQLRAGWLAGKYGFDSLAYRLFVGLAEDGVVKAQYNMGVMYQSGQGVEADAARAAFWFDRAAEQGLALAQNNLGSSYMSGRGVPRDEYKAAALFQKAANQGLALAQYNLGLSYLTGRGVPRNYGRAAGLFRRAAKQGHVDAMLNLEYLYQNGLGVSHDPAQAKMWRARAAKAAKGGGGNTR